MHSINKRVNAVGNVEYLGSLQCGHRGMVTSLKVFGDVLISGSRDGFVTIWSISPQIVNLSILHYGNEPVLDLSILPNPYPLTSITIWNEHLNALQERRREPMSKAPRSQTSRFLCADDSNPGWPSLPNDGAHDTVLESNKLTESPLPVSQYMSLHSLYDDEEFALSEKQRDTINSTIRGYCGNDDNAKAMLDSEDVPDVLQSVFRAAISTPGSSAGPECEDMVGPESPPQIPVLSPQVDPSESATTKVRNGRIHSMNDENDQKRPRWLSREIMNAASHCSGVPRIAQDLKLIVGGGSGEIHIWHIGGVQRSAVSPTTTWERESILRGHGDRVTRLATFGQHLVSGYSNGAIKLWKVSGDNSSFACCGTAYTDSVKRVGSAESGSYSEQADGKRKNLCNSVRSLLLLPSPTLNLKAMGSKHRNQNGNIWRNVEDENVNQLSEDEMELNFNELNVKVSANHVGDGPQRRVKDRKNAAYTELDQCFWILSGTSNGSMLLHKLDDEDDDESDLGRGNFESYL